MYGRARLDVIDLSHAPSRPRRTLSRSFVLRLALALGLALLARPAAAETPEPAALSWVRAEGADTCPAAPEVARRVEVRLGHDALSAPAQATLVVEAYVSPGAGGGFRATIALTKGGTAVGRRELEAPGPSCAELAEKAVLVIALMIDPEAEIEDATNEQVRTPPPVTAPPPASVAAAPPPAPPQTTRDVPPPWEGDVELALGVVSGLIPGLAPGVLARGRAWPPSFPAGLELEAGYFPKQTAEAGPGKTGSFSLIEAGIAVCSRPRRKLVVALSGCAGTEVGSISGQGSGFESTPSYQAWMFALAARGRVWFRPLPHFALVLGPDLAVPLKRDVFETTTPTTGTVPLWQVSAVAVGFELGVVLEL